MKLGLLFVISYIVIMAFKSILIKMLMQQGYSTIEVMMLRNVITFIVVCFVLFFLWYRKKLSIYSLKLILYLLIVGLLCFHVSSFFDLQSLNYISVNLERLIVHLYPSIVCVLLVLRDGVKAVNKQQWTAVALVYVATIVFIGFDASILFSWKGVLFAFLAAFFYAIYFVLIESSIKKYGATEVTLISLPLASLTIFAQFWITDGEVNLNSLTLNHVSFIIILGAVIGVGSMVLINQAVCHLGSSNTAIISSIGPFVTAGLAYVILGEALKLIQFIAMGCVVFALYQLSAAKK